MNMSVRAVVFHGRVQGVGFRWTTQTVAERFPVRGWVRNEPGLCLGPTQSGTPTVILCPALAQSPKVYHQAHVEGARDLQVSRLEHYVCRGLMQGKRK